jgi:predicted acyl esterase
MSNEFAPRRWMHALASTGAALALSASFVLPPAQAGRSDPVPETAYPGGTWEPGPAKYGSMLVEHVPIEMDDGVTLDATVAFPTDLVTGERARGRFPVVVEDSPYVEAVGFSTGPVNTYFAEHGYISVRVNTRGTGASGGVNHYWGPREARDGATVVDWAAHQLEGSDGRVALVGCSFPGGYALNDAAEVGQGSPVKAVIAACVGLETSNRHDVMVGGVPTPDIGFVHQISDWFMGGQPDTTEYYQQLVEDILAGEDPAYDREFWGERLPFSVAQKIVDNDIPVLLWSGWDDIVGVTAQRTYSAFQNAYAGRPVSGKMRPGQRTTPRYQLIMGDWGHAGGLDNGIALEWLETWVRGVDTGIQESRKPMHLFEKGTDRWINAAQYPQVSQYTTWYLDGTGSLSTRRPLAGRDEQSIAWGEPSEDGTSLTYSTEPIKQGMTLAGTVSTTIYATSSNTNLQLQAVLSDVAPDGTVTSLTEGSVVGSLRELDPERSWTDAGGTPSWPYQKLDRDAYLTPDKVYRYDIVLEPRQWGVTPGHRLRLDITTKTPGSDCPGPEVAGNGNSPCYLTAPQQATIPGGTYTLLTGRRYPSSIHLPQQRFEAAKEAECSVTPTSLGVCLPRDWATK